MWAGDNPYFLAIRQYISGEDDDGKPIITMKTAVVDLDEPNWSGTHAEIMRVPGVWMLCDKAQSAQQGVIVPVLIKQVEEDEQPFYTKRHIGAIAMGGGAGTEVVAYGLGVKQRDGTVDGMFILPNGSITTDDDVYWVGDKMNKGQL